MSNTRVRVEKLHRFRPFTITGKRINHEQPYVPPVPPVVPTYTLTSTTGPVDESATVTFTLVTTDVPDGLIPYTITGVSVDDFNPPLTDLTGNFNLIGGNANISFTLAEDSLTEPPESITLTLDGLGVSVSININDTSKTPEYVLFAVDNLGNPITEIFEGETITFKLSTSNVPTGEEVEYHFDGSIPGNIGPTGIVEVLPFNNSTPPPLPFFEIQSDGTDSFVVNTKIRAIPSTPEILKLVIPSVSLQKQITIKDRSPQFVSLKSFNGLTEITAINEGDTVTFELNTSNIPDGTQISYAISVPTPPTGSDFTTVSDDFDGLPAGFDPLLKSGHIVITSNKGTVDFTLKKDETTEGLEKLKLTLGGNIYNGTPNEILVNDITGPKTLSVDVNDTSITPYLIKNQTPGTFVELTEAIPSENSVEFAAFDSGEDLGDPSSPLSVFGDTGNPTNPPGDLALYINQAEPAIPVAVDTIKYIKVVDGSNNYYMYVNFAPTDYGTKQFQVRVNGNYYGAESANDTTNVLQNIQSSEQYITLSTKIYPYS